jgi:hypothetical protein
MADQRWHSEGMPGTGQPGGLAAGQPAGDLPAPPDRYRAVVQAVPQLGRDGHRTWIKAPGPRCAASRRTIGLHPAGDQLTGPSAVGRERRWL